MSPQPCKDSAFAFTCFYPPVNMTSPMTQQAMKEFGFLGQLNTSPRMTQRAKEQPITVLGKALASFGLPKTPSSDLGAKPHCRAPSLLWSPTLEHLSEPPDLCSSVEEPRSDQGHSAQVKRRDPKIQLGREVALRGFGLSGFTTVMLRNIPPSYNPSELQDEIDKNGFAGTYDFFSLPVNSRNDRNRGFAFINFMSASLAEEFYSKYHGQKLKRKSCVSLDVLPSDVQGYDQNIACFLASSTGHRKKRQIRPIDDGNDTIEQSGF